MRRLFALMARRPKRPHVLRTTLKILGLTQKELAERLGIASVTLEKFINGDSMISERLAQRISAETGVNFAQLLLNHEPLNPRLINDVRVTKQLVRVTKQLVNASLQASVENDQFYYQIRLRLRIVALLEELNLTARTKELLGLGPNDDLRCAISGL